MSPSSNAANNVPINNLYSNTNICERKTKSTTDANNNTEQESTILFEENVYDATCPKNESIIFTRIRKWERKMGFVTALRWDNFIFITAYHLVATIWSVYALSVRDWPKWQTFAFGMIAGILGGFGVTAGAHRLWSHKSYKATKPLKLILMFCFSVSGQNNIFNWVRDHRVHHKFSETSADPHDAGRGFFFSHVGWLMMRKHPAVIREGSKIDMSDITGDPLVRFHTKYFNVFKIVFCFVLPTLIPVLLWGETWEFAFVSQPFLRYMLGLNFTWAVNSFAHLWGNKPYDERIMPSENWGVSLIAFGEGWHNYHHTFPWDYKAAELAYTLNPTTMFLDLFAKIGWAYDLKVASPELIRTVMENRGALSNSNKDKTI